MSEWETVSGPTQKTDDGWETVPAEKPKGNWRDALAIIKADLSGIPRGIQDWRERLSQLTTGGEPGEVYGQRTFPMLPPAERAKALYKEALQRDLTPEEIAGIEAEPDIAFEQARQLANRAAAGQRREFDTTAPATAQITRAGLNIAPALAIRTPGAIAEAAGPAGVAARTLYNAATGGALGASEFVQPGQSRAENAALAAAVQSGVGLAGEGLKYLGPTKTLARETGLDEALESSATKAGRALKAKTGIDIRLSQFTGDVRVGAVESQVARYNEAARIAHADHVRTARQTGQLLEKTLNDIGAGKVNTKEAGSSLLTNLQRHYDAVDQQADDIFKGAFARFRATTGDKPVVGTDNVRQMLAARLKELNDLSVKTDDSVAEIKSISKMLKQFPEGRRINVSTLQSLLSEQGFASKGTGRQITDLASEKDRFVAGQIKRALLDDLDMAANQQTLPGEAAKVFRLARDEYGQLKEYQRVMGQQAFGRYLNLKTAEGTAAPAEMVPAPEDVYKSWKGLPPTQKGKFLSVLSTQDPQLRSTLQGAYFDDILSKSATKDGAPAGSYRIDMKELAKNWKVDDDFKTLFKGDAQKQLVVIREQLRRIADQEQTFGGGQSGISGGKQLAQTATGLATGSSQSLLFSAGWAYQKFTPKIWARLLYTPEGRQNLIKALKPTSYTPSEVAAATAYINRLTAEPPEEPAQ